MVVGSQLLMVIGGGGRTVGPGVDEPYLGLV